MTTWPVWLVYVGGSVALILGAMRVLATGLMVETQAGGAPKLPYSVEALGLFNLSSVFTPLFFGVVSLLHATALVSTPLGLTTCAGIAIYFMLRGVAYIRAPEMRRSRAYLSTSLTLLAAVCYAASALISFVI